MLPCNYNYQLINITNPLLYCPPGQPIFEFPEYCCPLEEPTEENVENLLAPNASDLAAYDVVIYNGKSNNQIFNQIIDYKNQVWEVVNKQIGRIFDQNNFMGVKAGDWIFFSHVNTMTQLAIGRLQTIFNLGSELIRNLTHVGIVTKVVSSQIIIVAESTRASSLTEREYNIGELPNDEDVLFVSPAAIARTEKARELAEAIVKTGREWATAPSDSNRYNLEGLLTIPFSESGFTELDKKRIIEAFVDSLYKSSPQVEKNGVLFDKKYFCSEFAQEVAQFSRFLHANSITPEMVKEDIKNLGLDFHSEGGREQIVKYLESRMKDVDLWNELARDPLFSIPARQATPGLLFDLALRHSSIIRVRNAENLERFDKDALTPESYPEYVEYLATKLLNRYLDGELISPEDKEVKELLIILENEMHYSKETLGCFVKECYQAANPSSCIENCLENTLTWKEKLVIFFLSREINRAVEQMLHHPLIIEFLHNPYDVKWRDPSIINDFQLTIDDILNNAFPLNMGNPLKSSENLLAKYFAKYFIKNLDKRTLFKYIPLSLAYAPPSETITNFLNGEDIPAEKLANHVFLLFSTLQSRNISPQSKQMQFIFKAFINSGIFKIDHSKMVPLLNKISKNTGYSLETLECITQNFPHKSIDPKDIENCLTETLSVQEKVNVFLSSQIITLGVENLLKNNHFKEFVHTGKIDSITKDSAGKDYLDILFPTDLPSYSESMKNHMGKVTCRRLLQEGLAPFMLKDVFLGLAYAPPSEPIKQFIEKEQLLTQSDLINLMYKFLTASV